MDRRYREGTPLRGDGCDSACTADVPHLLSEMYSALADTKGALANVTQSFRTVFEHRSAILPYFRSLETLHLHPSGTAEGAELRRFYSGRRWGVRRSSAVAVLLLPERPDAYLAGRDRQAVRTNRSRAIRSGCLVRHHKERDDALAAEVDSISRQLSPQFGALLASRLTGLGEFWFVQDGTGHAVAVSVLTVDGAVARLNIMLSVAGDDRAAARYLLASQVALDLAARGVGCIVMDTVFMQPPGLLYFQRRLGFTAMNVCLAACGRSSGSVSSAPGIGSA